MTGTTPNCIDARQFVVQTERTGNGAGTRDIEEPITSQRKFY